METSKLSVSRNLIEFSFNWARNNTVHVEPLYIFIFSQIGKIIFCHRLDGGATAKQSKGGKEQGHFWDFFQIFIVQYF